jgi:hypothetical protein
MRIPAIQKWWGCIYWMRYFFNNGAVVTGGLKVLSRVVTTGREYGAILGTLCIVMRAALWSDPVLS